MLSRRLLHSSTRSTARLINGAISVSPDLARTPPPLPPIENNRQPPRPPVQQPSSSMLKPIRRSPEVPHRPAATPSPDGDSSLSWRLENRNAHRSAGGLDTLPEKVRQEEEEAQTALQLDLFLSRTLSQLSAEVGQGKREPLTSLNELVRQRDEKSNAVVEEAVLEYESTPSPARRVRLDGKAGLVDEAVQAASAGAMEEQDGVVVVAHVSGRGDARVSVCSGFAVGKVGQGEGQVVLTCAHTLAGMEQHLTSSPCDTPSASFILTSSGHVYTAASVLSFLPGSDILLLRLSPAPINPSTLPVRRLRPLPVNPYPLPTSKGVSMHRYLNPLGRLRRKLQGKKEREWEEGRIVEYKDSVGRTAETGSYDELASMYVSTPPLPGSSGGPIVCRETGSVVGVIRGSSHKYGDRQSYGFATPAEKILEMFTIPGFKTTAQREAEREAAAAAAASVAATATAPEPTVPTTQAHVDLSKAGEQVK
ncbi:hypothetical protein JCM8547_003442 [Rhodosporidiobolus lusitaniae]